METKTFTRQRHKTKYCPCGKSNKDGKFASFKGYEGEPYGYCHSCLKSFFKDSEQSIIPQKIKPLKPINYCGFTWEDIGEIYDENIQSTFAQYLNKTFGEKATIEAIQKYHLGNIDGNVVYWQIGIDNTIRGGKIMSYNPNGKRGKYTNWMHNYKKMSCTLKQCFFGERLIEKDKNIWVVEGEKTAIIMSMIHPDRIWISCGGLGGLNPQKCKALKNYNVILCPDAGCYDEWAKEGERYGFDVTYDSENYYKKGLIDEGEDIADYYLKNFKDEIKSDFFPKKIDPTWEYFVENNPQLNLEK